MLALANYCFLHQEPVKNVHSTPLRECVLRARRGETSSVSALKRLPGGARPSPRVWALALAWHLLGLEVVEACRSNARGLAGRAAGEPLHNWEQPVTQSPPYLLTSLMQEPPVFTSSSPNRHANGTHSQQISAQQRLAVSRLHTKCHFPEQCARSQLSLTSFY